MTKKTTEETPFGATIEEITDDVELTPVLSEAELKDLGNDLGIKIETTEEPQHSNSAEAKIEAGLILPVVRAWINGTALRELYLARQRGQVHKKVTINLQRYCKELSSKTALKLYTKKYVDNMCRDPKTRAERVQEALFNLKQLFDRIDKAAEEKETWQMSPWGLIRAMNTAISRSNYGKWMQKAGYIFTGDSDHRIVTTMLTGDYKWTEPENFVIATLDAETEEEYLKPFTVEDIPNPDNPDETVKIRVYRRSGNVVHPSSSVTMDEIERNDPLVQSLKNLHEGASTYKKYDPELHVSEFERQADSDVNYCMNVAEDMGIRLWPLIDSERKTVFLMHGGIIGGTSDLNEINV